MVAQLFNQLNVQVIKVAYSVVPLDKKALHGVIWVNSNLLLHFVQKLRILLHQLFELFATQTSKSAVILALH